MRSTDLLNCKQELLLETPLKKKTPNKKAGLPLPLNLSKQVGGGKKQRLMN